MILSTQSSAGFGGGRYRTRHIVCLPYVCFKCTCAAHEALNRVFIKGEKEKGEHWNITRSELRPPKSQNFKQIFDPGLSRQRSPSKRVQGRP